ncbi:hypothetical protein [Pseudomonas sp. PAMC 29040]|nr:hypothetical protein [Pseudomonas sp. PAMC 29040]
MVLADVLRLFYYERLRAIVMGKMAWFLGGFLALTIGIGILATIPPG